MADKKIQGFTSEEKIELLAEAISNVIVFLESKYPDFYEESKAARKKHNEKLKDEE